MTAPCFEIVVRDPIVGDPAFMPQPASIYTARTLTFLDDSVLADNLLVPVDVILSIRPRLA